MSAKDQFEFCFNQITTTVPFKYEWHNGTGYLDGLVHETIEGLEVGDRFITRDERGRRVIGLITPFGNIVVFERYTGDGTPIVNNVPVELNTVIRSGAMSGPEILSAVGGFEYETNLGKVLDLAMKTAKGEYVPHWSRDNRS